MCCVVFMFMCCDAAFLWHCLVFLLCVGSVVFSSWFCVVMMCCIVAGPCFGYVLCLVCSVAGCVLTAVFPFVC